MSDKCQKCGHDPATDHLGIKSDLALMHRQLATAEAHIGDLEGIIEGVMALREFGGFYSKGTHAKILWERIDKGVARSLPRLAGRGRADG